MVLRESQPYIGQKPKAKAIVTPNGDKDSNVSQQKKKIGPELYSGKHIKRNQDSEMINSIIEKVKNKRQNKDVLDYLTGLVKKNCSSTNDSNSNNKETKGFLDIAGKFLYNSNFIGSNVGGVINPGIEKTVVEKGCNLDGGIVFRNSELPTQKLIDNEKNVYQKKGSYGGQVFTREEEDECVEVNGSIVKNIDHKVLIYQKHQQSISANYENKENDTKS